MKNRALKNTNSLFYIMGIVFGLLTFGLVSESLMWAVIGAAAGFVMAFLFIKAFVHGKSYQH